MAMGHPITCLPKSVDHVLNLEAKELIIRPTVVSGGFRTQKRPGMEYGGALVHVQQPRLELVAVSGDARKQLMQSVRNHCRQLECSLNGTSC